MMKHRTVAIDSPVHNTNFPLPTLFHTKQTVLEFVSDLGLN